MHDSGLAQSSEHAKTFTDGTVSHRVFLQKVLDVKAPRDW
jgi:transcriptional regulator of NAD metabolism